MENITLCEQGYSQNIESIHYDHSSAKVGDLVEIWIE